MTATNAPSPVYCAGCLDPMPHGTTHRVCVPCQPPTYPEPTEAERARWEVTADRLDRNNR